MINDFNDADTQVIRFPDPNRIEKLKSTLHAQATSFVKELFPAARIQRGEARIGSVLGDPGASLWVALTGAKTGQWRDHATDQQGGDLISLYAAAERLDLKADFPRILDELEKMVGISQPKPRQKSPTQIKREEEGTKASQNDDPLGAPTATWHYFDAESNIIATVYRHELANGGKTFRPWDAISHKAAMPAIRPLYNIPVIQHAEPVILVEGEKCADVLTKLGYAATTAMGGAHAPVDKTNWDPIKGKRVIIWPDADKPGQDWLTKVRPVLEALGCVASVVTVPDGVPEGWDAADGALDGTDISAIIKGATAPQEGDYKPRFTIYRASDLEKLEAPEWMIEGYLPAQGFTSIYGPSGSYKSFIAIDLCLHLAHGMEWCGKPTQKKRILYIAGEGRFGILQRLQAWHQSHQLPITDDFCLLPWAIDMMDPEAEINNLISDINHFPVKFDIAVVDTVARSFGSGDENSAKDMGSFIRNCDRLRHLCVPHVMAIHHSGKDIDKGARGSSAFRAALDTEIQAKRSEGSKRVKLVMTKQKDAEEADPVLMEAVSVEFTDKDGVIQKSAIMKYSANIVRSKSYMGVNEEAVLNVLREHPEGISFSSIVSFSHISKRRVAETLRNLKISGVVIHEDDLYRCESEVSHLEDENNE